MTFVPKEINRNDILEIAKDTARNKAIRVYLKNIRESSVLPDGDISRSIREGHRTRLYVALKNLAFLR